MTEHLNENPPAEHRVVASPEEQIAYFTRERRRQAIPREMVLPVPEDTGGADADKADGDASADDET